MTYYLQPLTVDSIHVLFRTFLEAFSDYVQDVSSVTETSFTNRAIKNAVDFECSVGAFDRGKMIGFTGVALDNFYGTYSAFDAFTGVIKPYRGQGLAKAMFDFVVPKLKAEGVRKFYLEVLQNNEPVIHAYQKTGFTTTRELDSFEINFEEVHLDQEIEKDVVIRNIHKSGLAQVSDFFDWQPSWENSLSSIQRIPDEVLILGAFVQNKLVGFLVYYPALKWILNLAIHKSYRHQKIGASLIAQLKNTVGSQIPTVKIINVEHTDKEMIKFLNTVGFRFTMNQFEMKLDL